MVLDGAHRFYHSWLIALYQLRNCREAVVKRKVTIHLHNVTSTEARSNQSITRCFYLRGGKGSKNLFVLTDFNCAHRSGLGMQMQQTTVRPNSRLTLAFGCSVDLKLSSTSSFGSAYKLGLAVPELRRSEYAFSLAFHILSGEISGTVGLSEEQNTHDGSVWDSPVSPGTEGTLTPYLSGRVTPY